MLAVASKTISLISPIWSTICKSPINNRQFKLPVLGGLQTTSHDLSRRSAAKTEPRKTNDEPPPHFNNQPRSTNIEYQASSIYPPSAPNLSSSTLHLSPSLVNLLPSFANLRPSVVTFRPPATHLPSSFRSAAESTELASLVFCRDLLPTLPCLTKKFCSFVNFFYLFHHKDLRHFTQNNRVRKSLIQP